MTPKSPVLVSQQTLEIFRCFHFLPSVDGITQVSCACWKESRERHSNISLHGVFVHWLSAHSRHLHRTRSTCIVGSVRRRANHFLQTAFNLFKLRYLRQTDRRDTSVGIDHGIFAML